MVEKFKEVKLDGDPTFVKGIESKNISASLFKTERGIYARVVNWKTNDRWEIGFPFGYDPQKINLERAVKLSLRRNLRKVI